MENKKVNFMVGRFQPLTNGHLRCIEEAYKETGYKTVLCMVSSDGITENKPLPCKYLQRIYHKLIASGKIESLEDIISVKSANIIEISEALDNNGYTGYCWICGSDRSDSYAQMLSKYADRCRLDAFSRTLSFDRIVYPVSATSVRESLLEADFTAFCNQTPYEKIFGTEYTRALYSDLRYFLTNPQNKLQ